MAGALAPGTPVAQKNGWLRAARHGAALVYDAAGPRVVVVLTYRASGVSRAQAAALAQRAAQLAGEAVSASPRARRA